MHCNTRSLHPGRGKDANQAMRSLRTTLIAAAAAGLCAAAAAPATALTLVPVSGPNGTVPFKSPGGFGPTFVTSRPGDRHDLYVGTKDGYVYVVRDGVTLPTPLLDIHTQVSTHNEDGMFSLVFDPNFASNRWFYVDYSDTVANGTANENTDNYHLDAFEVSASDPNVADPATQRQILEVPTTDCLDMSSAHYGGQLAFGPDGHLWLSLGDGGDGGGDPATRGSNCDRSSPLWAPDLTSLHGKILRIDPQPTAPPNGGGNRYAVPATNPLAGQGGGVRTEVWAYGLRNPWRFSFDSASPHELVIGDVGNAQQEEIDGVPSTLAPGAAPPFFGWPCTEGDDPFFPPANCAGTPTAVTPNLVVNHTGPINDPDCMALIGGLVLHDPSLGGDYDGRYLYGFFCGGTGQSIAGELFTTNLSDATPAPRDEGVSVGLGLSSFGSDACGNPYVTNVVTGGLWRIDGATPGTCTDPPPPPPPPPPRPGDTTPTTPEPTPTAPTPTGPAPPPAFPIHLHIRLTGLTHLQLNFRHQIKVTIGPTTQDARGTLTLRARSGSDRFAPPVDFHTKAGQPRTITLSPPKSVWRTVTKDHPLLARLTLAMKGTSDNRTATATTDTRVVALH